MHVQYALFDDDGKLISRMRCLKGAQPPGWELLPANFGPYAEFCRDAAGVIQPEWKLCYCPDTGLEECRTVDAVTAASKLEWEQAPSEYDPGSIALKKADGSINVFPRSHVCRASDADTEGLPSAVAQNQEWSLRSGPISEEHQELIRRQPEFRREKERRQEMQTVVAEAIAEERRISVDRK